MKDPYLKPVVFGGLLITMLSVVFAPAVFLWAAIGGYVAVRIANKITREIISIPDGLLLGLFSGTIGGTCFDIFTMISLRSPDSQSLLIRILEKNWPKEAAPMPDLLNLLPALLLTTSIFVIIVTVVFAILGSYIGVLISKQKNKTNN